MPGWPSTPSATDSTRFGSNQESQKAHSQDIFKCWSQGRLDALDVPVHSLWLKEQRGILREKAYALPVYPPPWASLQDFYVRQHWSSCWTSGRSPTVYPIMHRATFSPPIRSPSIPNARSPLASKFKKGSARENYHCWSVRYSDRKKRRKRPSNPPINGASRLWPVAVRIRVSQATRSALSRKRVCRT